MLSPTYELNLGEITVSLPLVRTDGLCLYSLNLMGKGKLNACFAQMLSRALEQAGCAFDVIVAVEAKSLGLVQELSQRLGHAEYAVLRKTHKLYMGANALSVASGSITTAGAQRLWLDAYDAALIRGKRILFVDDVISTGKTKEAADKLLALADAQIAAVACVATEGKHAQDNPDGWIRLGHIPLYDEQEHLL